jgi:hypothetical protein
MKSSFTGKLLNLSLKTERKSGLFVKAHPME